MFKINNVEWNILFVPPHHPELRMPDGSFTLGSCSNITKTIYLSFDLNYKLQKVLCHELVHATLFSYNIQLNSIQEEELADIIATYGNLILSLSNELIFKIRAQTNAGLSPYFFIIRYVPFLRQLE